MPHGRHDDAVHLRHAVVFKVGVTDVVVGVSQLHLAIDRRVDAQREDGDVAYGSELTAVVQMFVLQPEEVPDKAPEGKIARKC